MNVFPNDVNEKRSQMVVEETEVKHLLLYVGANLENLQPEELPPIARGPYCFRRAVPRVAIAETALVYSQSKNQRFEYVGILRDAIVRTDVAKLEFSGYEPFRSPVLACDLNVGIECPYPNAAIPTFSPEFNYISERDFNAICRLGSRPPDLARRFCQELITLLDQNQELVAEVASRCDTSQNAPQKLLHGQIESILTKLSEPFGLTDDLIFSDFEGKERDHKQIHSYPLLGTWTHPDAAVLSPFRCAIEYDRQTNSLNSSHLKYSMGKTAAHVQSGRYEAAIEIYLLHPNTTNRPIDYLKDGEGTTRRYLQEMERLGVYVFVGPDWKALNRSKNHLAKEYTVPQRELKYKPK